MICTIENHFYIAEFRFLDSFRLTALVDKKTGVQHLKIAYIDEKGKEIDPSYIMCIHTIIATTTLEEIEDSAKNNEFPQKFLKPEAFEQAKPIKLSPEENFTAFKSWVGGIAEAGIEGFYLQEQLENLVQMQIPISFFLLNYVSRHNIEIFRTLILLLERRCQYNGKPHIPSLLANLMWIKELDKKEDPTSFQNILESICNIALPLEIYLELFDPEDVVNKLSDHPDFSKLFDSNDAYVRIALASAPNAVYFEEYKKFFSDPGQNIRKAIASNPKATQFEEFKPFFDDKNIEIREIVAANPEAAKFNQYDQFFDDDTQRIRIAVASNPGAAKKDKYKKFFSDPDWKVRGVVAANPEAEKYKEYSLLFYDPDFYVRRVLASDMRSVKYPQYRDFIQDTDFYVRVIVASNPEATRFDNFRELFEDDNEEVRFALTSNPNATKFEEYANLFYDSEWFIRAAVAKNPESANFEDFKILFEDEDQNVIDALLLNSRASEFNEYKELLKKTNVKMN